MEPEDLPVRVTVRCFGAVRELLAAEQLAAAVDPGTTVEQLLHRYAEQHPRLRSLGIAYAVNLSYAKGDQVLCDGDEVAFIPPISGGAGAADIYRFEFSDAELDPRSLEAEVRTDADGAVALFAGTTRNHNEGDQVLHLYYEAYEEMAQKVMGRIFEEAVKRFPITRARVAHRLGEVPVGATSVLVVVAAAHRGPAFEACRFLIDRLKDEVPIFKREQLVGEDGQTRWIGDLPRPEA